MSGKDFFVELKLEIERIKKDLEYIKERLSKMENAIADIDKRLREQVGV